MLILRHTATHHVWSLWEWPSNQGTNTWTSITSISSRSPSLLHVLVCLLLLTTPGSTACDVTRGKWHHPQVLRWVTGLCSTLGNSVTDPPLFITFKTHTRSSKASELAGNLKLLYLQKTVIEGQKTQSDNCVLLHWSEIKRYNARPAIWKLKTLSECFTFHPFYLYFTPKALAHPATLSTARPINHSTTV